VQQLKVLAFTHKKTPLKELSRFYLHDENKFERLAALKFATDIDEILYVATCNRIEFLFRTSLPLNRQFIQRFFKNFRTDWIAKEIQFAVDHCEAYEGDAAVEHIFNVASSLDSMVVGEREIITQVRKAYDECNAEGLTGDLLRLVIKSTITTAKQVYTDTRIADNPVSVVSLAYRKLRDMHIAPDAKIVMIGAGETNTNLSKYLAKYGSHNISIFNRTLDNAQKLADQLAENPGNYKAYSLKDLKTIKTGFDVLITCTNAPEPIVTPAIYDSLLNGDTAKKVLIDLAMPADIDPQVISTNNISLINIEELKSIAEKNLAERQSELVHAKKIVQDNVAEFRHLLRTRKIELAMKNVPEKIREIKNKAVTSVFAKEIETLDPQSKEVLDKVLNYMEKKCIGIPMVMAKEIILETE